MTSTVKNIKVGNTSYPIQDTKATPFLSSADEATLLSDGTYRGETVANGTIFTKPDGTLNEYSATPMSPTWVSNATFQNANLQAYNGNTIVTLPGSNTRYVQVSTNGGSTWTQREAMSSTYASNQGMGLCFHKGFFYVLGRWGFSSSPDGITWTLLKYGDGQSAAYDTKLGGYLLSNGTTMVRLNTGLPYYYDEDSAAWVQASSSSSVWATSGTVDPITKIFYAAGNTGGVVLKSSDGKTWTTTTRPTTSDVTVAAYNNLVLAASSSAVYYSVDGGSTWTQSFATNSGNVRVLDGVFIIYVSGETKNYISTDGYTWTAVSGGYVNTISIVTYNGSFRGNERHLPTTLQYDYTVTPLSYTVSEVDTALGEKQAATIVGSSDPTSALKADAGAFYLNNSSGDSYIAVGDSSGTLVTNYTTSGTVNVTADGVATFNSGAYINPPKNWTYSGSPWAVEMKFKTPTSYASSNGVCMFRWGSTDCMIFLNSAGYVVACGWSSGSQPRAAVSLNTIYWLRVEYDGTNINLYLSTTGTFPSTPTASSTSPAYWPGNNIACYVGGKASSETYNGSIYLTDVKWYSNGSLVWQAATVPTYAWKQLVNEDNLDTALSGKQDTLTAGTGISIINPIVRDYTVVGTHVSVTDEGIASGFYATSDYSDNSYIKSPSTLPSYSTLYFEIEFTMPSTLFSADEALIIMENEISDLFISGQNRVIATWNGSNYVGGSTLLSAGQTYKLRGTETNGTIVIEMLVNGSWVEQIRTSYTPFKNGYNIALGTMVSYYPSFEGSIDLSKTFIKVDGLDWWRPFVIQSAVISATGGGGGSSYTAGTGIAIDSNNVISNTGLINTATGTDSLTILGSAATDYDATNIGKQSYSGIGGVAVGRTASAGTSSVAVGHESFAYGGNYATAIGGVARATSERAIAVGYAANATASHAIQIGRGSNSTANTMNVGLSSSLNVQLLDSSGNIPAARLSNIYEVVQTVPASPTEGKIYFVTGS